MNYAACQNIYKLLFLIIFFSINLLVITACDKQAESDKKQSTAVIKSEVNAPVEIHDSHDDKITIENESYLFDVSSHTMEELEALLARAEEVSQAHAPGYDDLKIVMIIHGPDIDWFTQQHYQNNRQLIDLAARLDAYDIIDMKVCEKTMNKRGVDRKDIPSFIESVPYAPVEIKQRLNEGYINL